MTFNIANWFEILSALICTIAWIYKPLVINKWFVLFLWLTVVVEIVGKLTVKMSMIKMPVYNLFNGLEFFFYFSFILFLNQQKAVRIFMRFTLSVFGLFFLSNILLAQGLYTYNNHTHTFGAILVILSSLLMLYKISAMEIDFLGILKWPFLCIILGLLIYYVGNLLNTAMFNYSIKNNPAKAVSLYKLVNHSLNVVLYTAFGAAFVIELYNNNKQQKMFSSDG